jgi:hypothetical protein
VRQGYAAAEFALRYPYLISAKKQLNKVEHMLSEAPDALGLPLQQLLTCFVAHPALFKYGSVSLLAQRFHELAACFNISGAKTCLFFLTMGIIPYVCIAGTACASVRKHTLNTCSRSCFGLQARMLRRYTSATRRSPF